MAKGTNISLADGHQLYSSDDELVHKGPRPSASVPRHFMSGFYLQNCQTLLSHNTYFNEFFVPVALTHMRPANGFFPTRVINGFFLSPFFESAFFMRYQHPF